MNSIPTHYRFIEIQLNVLNTGTLKNFETTGRLTHHLDLNQSPEKIQAVYAENLKRNLKRALKNKIELSSDIPPSEIIRLFRKNKGKKTDQLKNKDYEMLLQLIHEADHRKLVTVLGAKTAAGNWCAGALFLESYHEYIFFFSAANDAARNSGAMSLLIDHFVHLHSRENMNLDFEGSMDKNLARFYKGFGSKEIVYLQVRKNRLPSYMKWIKR